MIPLPIQQKIEAALVRFQYEVERRARRSAWRHGFLFGALAALLVVYAARL